MNHTGGVMVSMIDTLNMLDHGFEPCLKSESEMAK